MVTMNAVHSMQHRWNAKTERMHHVQPIVLAHRHAASSVFGSLSSIWDSFASTCIPKCMSHHTTPTLMKLDGPKLFFRLQLWTGRPAIRENWCDSRPVTHPAALEGPLQCMRLG